MSTVAAIGVYSRTDDWIVVGVALLSCYLVIYPLYIYYLRRRRSRVIKRHLVTSQYKLPIKLTPVEFAYVFSVRVNSRQLYATLLDLTNRGVLVMHNTKGKKTVGMGPKMDDSLHSFEKMLVGHIHAANDVVPVDNILKGTTNYGLSNGEKIQGSRQYVFWWLLRHTMRERKLIEKHMTGRYSRVLFLFAVIGGLIVSVLPLLSLRFIQMLQNGEVEIDRLMQSTNSAVFLWLIVIVPLILFSFILLRYRGRMLGRQWLMTPSFFRYLGQLEGYREFVRLVHRDKLRFDSESMEKESKAETRPYAIALGFVKDR